MTEDSPKTAAESSVPIFRKTLLEEQPQTDPAIIAALNDGRLNNEHMATIGRVAVFWSIFESHVDYWMIKISGIDTEVGMCFTSQIGGPGKRMEAFTALARLRTGEKRWNARLEALAVEVRSLGELRNRAVHDPWDLANPSKPLRLEVTARSTLKNLVHEHPTEDLSRLVGHIDGLIMRFNDCAQEIYDALHPSPKINQLDEAE